MFLNVSTQALDKLYEFRNFITELVKTSTSPKRCK